MGNAADNIAVTRAIFGPESDPGSGREEDHQALLDHLADDVVFRATVPDGTPISGELHGSRPSPTTSPASARSRSSTRRCRSGTSPTATT